MKIKRLEIKGFKSFPDKTVIEFKPGITAVVGPNGCGKSNVLESIRWAMGEQRARTLRGKKMEDVIFNGSDSRKAVGMAEVQLVLSNTDGLSPASMADYDEIMIARRLFRDGDSQYEINGIPCRLSDVVDFFLDTGVGKNSYAIIEQGRVDMIVASKPEDRRVLIEEAAGINRYKSRKEAALKKLEQTKQNLVRISDIVSEVKRQSTALKRQAARAERYRKLTEELRSLDLSIHSWKYREVETEKVRVDGVFREEHAKLTQCEADYSRLSAALEAEKLKALELDKKLKDLVESRHKADVELTALRGRIEKHRSGIAQSIERQRRSTEERVVIVKKLGEASSLKNTLQKNRNTIAESMTAASEDLKQAQSSMRAADQSLVTERRTVEQCKENVFRTLQESAQERNRVTFLQKRAREIDLGLEKIAGELQSISDAQKADALRRDALAAELETTTKALTEQSASKDRLSADRENLRKQIVSMRESLSLTEKEFAVSKARFDSLSAMQHEFRSYDEGVRFLMVNKDTCGSDSLLGPLAEMVEVAPEHRKALAAALGNRLGHLVVETPQHGAESANLLKERAAGRSGFLPRKPRFESNKECSPGPEEATRLSEIVSFRAGCEELGSFLLNDCFVVDDLATAVRLWESNGYCVDFVTKTGEVLTKHGELIGGLEDSTREEIFRDRHEMADLEKKLQDLGKRLTILKSELKANELKENACSKDLESCRARMGDLNVKEAGLKKDLERLDAQLSGYRRRTDILQLESENLQKEKLGLDDETLKSESKITVLETKRQALEKQKEESARKVEELHATARENSRSTGELRVKLAQLEERNRSIDREFQAVSETVVQYESRITALTRDVESAGEEEKRLTLELESCLAGEQELLAVKMDLSEKIQFLQKESEELSESVRNTEEQASRSDKSMRELREKVHSLEMESVRLTQILEGIVEKILERYRTDPRTVPCPDVLPDDAGIDELRTKIEAMGEVNPAAIAESRTIQERLVFLLEQEADLKKAVESLYATINAINKTTQERFRTAFENINEQFQQIFPFLFRGGEARLELTDKDDLLETGVEILARPPGKRIQNMDLLSGGEKALTAVALIFSIFLTKPSPFCLLDEVDAPLDDSNLSRFNEMLRKLGDKTQFLIITHNKRSMEEADSLYGVTMEESGVSRVVSVQFAS